MQPQPLYSLVLSLAAILAVLIATMAWSRRAAPGAWPLFAYVITIILWTVPYAVHWLLTDLNARYFWLDATYLGAASSSVAFLVFALEYTGHSLKRRTLLALSIIPALTLLALFTDSFHGLFYGSQRTPGLIYSGGPAFWINIGYAYILDIIGLLVLLRAFRPSPLVQRRQIGLVLIGALVPFVSSLISFTGLSPLKDLDLTPLAFTVTGLFFAAGLFRFGMFDLAPIARGVLIEHLPDGMLVLDLQQRIVDLNPAAGRLLDRTAAQLIGRTLPQVLDHWPMSVPTTDQAATPIELVLPAGRIAEARLSALIDRYGQRQGDVILLRDITDRKRAEAALQQLNASLETQVLARTAELRAEKDKSDTILRSVGEALVLTDLDFQIQYVNEAFTTLTGYAADEALGQSIGLRAAWPATPEVLPALQQGAMWRGEVMGRRNDQRPYEAALTVAPVRDGREQLIGCVISYQDITQHKSLERARMRFIESISHEFRTPLTSLGIYLELLQSGKRPEKTAQYLGQIADQTQRLQRLIQDSLEMAALDTQPLLDERQMISLPSLAQAASQYVSTRAEAKGITLHVVTAGELRVWGDESRLTQALQEVVDNAVGFTPSGGRVTLSTRSETLDATLYGVIEVSDTGPGLTADELPRLFERFYRGRQAESGHIPGSGLGLSIAQAIVRAHGGDITVHSETGHGSTFSLRLPAAR
ncbi:MAG: PAS domain S-box protein [Thermoflexales bacterium]|nr:PAS domain S-box protein [Thermoflexales bacterium]